VTFDDKVRALSDLYGAFNRREIERVLTALSPDVRWPNVLENTELRGHDAVRAYWLPQLETIEPLVEPVEFEERDDAVAVKVRQAVRRKATGHVTESRVTHVYRFDHDGRVTSMVVA